MRESNILGCVYTNIQKPLKVFPNQKLWMKNCVRALLREQDMAFRSSDTQASKAAQGNLKRTIKETKCKYRQGIEEHNVNNIPCRMWDGIKVLTDYWTNIWRLIDKSFRCSESFLLLILTHKKKELHHTTCRCTVTGSTAPSGEIHPSESQC